MAALTSLAMIKRLQRAMNAAVLIAAAATASPTGEEKAAKTIVFVCEHGTVKSVIAMQLFNKLAAEEGSELRAVSRGTSPDSTVPQPIARALSKDGLNPVGFKAKGLTRADLQSAARVVSIGVDVLPVTKGSAVPVEAWNDIPAASVDYPAARDALKAKVLDLLQREARPTPPPR